LAKDRFRAIMINMILKDRFNIQNITGVKFFTLSGLFFLGFLWLGLILTFLGFFHAPILAIFGGFSMITLAYLFHANRHNFHFQKEYYIIGIASLAFIVIFSYFTEPTIFSGRDQGTLSNAAIALSKNHSLTFNFPAQQEFFKIYGPGTALNFPGFNYDENGNLISHFPPGYISYLASFYSFFGIFGFILANALAFLFFLISFFLMAKNYLEKKSAMVAFFLVLTSFVFSWFFKFTLSENLGLALVWFSLFQLILFLKNQNKLNLLAHLLAFGFLIFVRIETLAFLAVSLFILYRQTKNWKSFVLETLGKGNLVALIFIFLMFLASLKINSAFYVAFVKGFFNSFDSISGESDPIPFPFASFFYVLRVFSAYAILTYLVLAVASFIYFLKKKNFKILIPFFILLPSFFYILSPSITLDHPWMLRRYVFSVIPVSILYSMIFLEILTRKTKIFFLFSTFLLLTNLLVFVPYLSVKENDNLFAEVKEISENFGEKDLILIDRDATGDPWAMMSGPLNLLFQKQAVYFFNFQDLEKIETEKFENVYLIIPDGNLSSYTRENFLEKFSPIENYTIEKSSLGIFSERKTELLQKSITLPPYQKSYIYGKIYLLEK
jgi:hypothetical protein